MAEPATANIPTNSIVWKDDMYGGVILDAASVPSEPQAFSGALAETVHALRTQGKRGVWLKVLKEQSSLIPVLVQQGFDFHHADPGHVMMTLWLPEQEPSTLPPNASHQVGIGAFVLNERGEILVVQERRGHLKGRSVWKMPTGLVQCGEDVTVAAEREVLEETGIRAKFDCVLAVRQSHGFAFGKSDIFVLCAMKAEPGQDVVTIQESELEAGCWLPLVEYTEQGTFKGVPLYDKMNDRCLAYAAGKYTGFAAAKLESSLSFSRNQIKKRQDILMWGESHEQ